MIDEEKSEKKEMIKTSNALVFISHDTRDAKLAEAFSSLLKNVSAGVLKSFRSSDRKGNQGIEYGVEWYPEIIKNIQAASDVVCLLTERSVDRPWILFEAGMAKGKLETPIFGVALGISLKNASSGPFAQFQNCGDDEDSLTKLVFQLVGRIPNSEPDQETIKFQVNKFKDSISEILQTDRGNKGEEVVETSNKDNSSAKLFEEIKVMFQDLPYRIESHISPKNRNRKRRRFPPFMIKELIHMSESGKAGLIFGLGMIREAMPWIYDLGLETIRIIDSSNDDQDKQRALMEFQEIVHISMRHPLMEEFIEFKDEYMFFEEYPHVIMREMERYSLRRLK